MPDVEVWQVDLRQPAGWVKAAADDLLAPEEVEYAARGATPVRQRRIVARAALRVVLSRLLDRPPASLRFAIGPNGKPVLEDPSAEELHFNLSRSDDCCLIAATAVGPIGVDVERVADVAQLEAVVARRFAPAEATAILALRGERRLRAFFRCWTRKEAYLKASGSGLTSALDGVVGTVDDDGPAIVSLEDDDKRAWSLSTVDPGPDLLGAVAVRGDHDRAGARIEASLLSLPPGSGEAPTAHL